MWTDPLPTWLLKECIAESVPVNTSIINASIKHSYVPIHFKIAYIKPLIKKQGLDKELLKNDRSVSNLTFVCKILEKVVFKQLEEHLANNELMDVLRSAYWAKHSTETALLKVQSNILTSLDEEGSVVLVLLDLSAAFDTIDNAFVLSRLHDMYGIHYKTLAWIRSYLSDRLQRVNIKRTLLDFGVPHGSVLGLILYSLYTKPVSDIIHRFGL